MYSVVLMMAMSGGAEVPDFGRRGCNGGCHGCNGYVSCHGHNGCHGCHGGHVVVSHGCNGCHGYVSCNGCSGRRGLFGKRRCNGCNGCHGYSSCHGCHGGHHCHGSVVIHNGHGCTGCHGGHVVPHDGGTTTTEPKVKEMPSTPKKSTTPPAKTSAPATIQVTLPAEARLFVDGNPTTSTSERRTFVTPALETGSSYVYTLRAEVVREGQTVVETQEVTVRGGQMTQVPFNFSSQGVASR